MRRGGKRMSPKGVRVVRDWGEGTQPTKRQLEG
ncbi:addiction module toxin RelE [Salmonella enterica]|nr:addiction module toxin RelE [Salmonella enterica]EBI8102263.1 addiction module toxin RelE [Salmonella enterica]EBK3005964.1 addiction module toxin RelE [Salmonella enterica]EBK9152956.1 addiction module toxin RelE [Salmonella enterica]EBL6690759.1 addiction module toxin RelE [Salmonella enterica]